MKKRKKEINKYSQMRGNFRHMRCKNMVILKEMSKRGTFRQVIVKLHT